MKTILSLALLSLLAVSCANQNTGTSDEGVNETPIKPMCSAPPMPQNIWKLEPMLKQKGLITDDMTRSEKETVIRDYINKKNSAYINCVKGKK
ncbi:hypothetical protein DZA50_05115 [Kangiella sp. HD9-110m-PIT-SAG07]|nr:hypothetical protein DZA50_05115 [Kangiella sp. HD9-110m-PIT-SAG07]